MKATIEGMRFECSISTEGVVTINKDEFTTEEREHRYQLGDVRSVWGRMYIACCCLRDDRWWWFKRYPNDIITWRHCDTETASDVSSWKERARYAWYY